MYYYFYKAKEIKEIQDQIVEEFDIFDSWMDKTDTGGLGKSVPEIDDINKTDDNIIKGCQSKFGYTRK